MPAYEVTLYHENRATLRLTADDRDAAKAQALDVVTSADWVTVDGGEIIDEIVFAIGDRVAVDVAPDWSEPATVTEVNGLMATVQLDETIEVPDAYGGGWMFVVDREIITLDRLREDI